jgi:hypothetical protein
MRPLVLWFIIEHVPKGTVMWGAPMGFDKFG